MHDIHLFTACLFIEYQGLLHYAIQYKKWHPRCKLLSRGKKDTILVSVYRICQKLTVIRLG